MAFFWQNPSGRTSNCDCDRTENPKHDKERMVIERSPSDAYIKVSRRRGSAPPLERISVFREEDEARRFAKSEAQSRGLSVEDRTIGLPRRGFHG